MVETAWHVDKGESGRDGLTMVDAMSGVKGYFARTSLRSLAREAVRLENSPKGHVAFARFQRDMMQRQLRNWRYEFFVFSIITLDENSRPVAMEHTLLDLPDEIVESYQAIQSSDDLSLTAYSNPGRAIPYRMIRSHKAWLEHDLFKNHLFRFGIHRATTLAFRFQGHRESVLTFDFLGDESNESWERFDHARLELYAFPFAQAWLFRMGRIDQPEFESRLERLMLLTEAQLQNLRKFINAPYQTLKEQAQDLGIEESSFKESLYGIRARIAKMPTDSVLGYQMPAKGNLRPLADYFSFLDSLGDQTKDIAIVRM